MRRSIVARDAKGLVVATLSTGEIPFGESLDDESLKKLGSAEMLRRELVRDGDEGITFLVQEIE